MVDMDATEYKERVVNKGTIPEFDSYCPYYLGTDKNGELKPPTEGDMKALFAKKKPKEGEIGGRDEEVNFRSTIGTRILCRLMKDVVKTGMRPTNFNSMFADNLDLCDKEREAIRKRSSSMVRKLILGTFGVRSYDYFRTKYLLEDHLHIDPVFIFCAVVKQVRTYSGSLMLVNQGMQLPDQLTEQHEAKQRSAMKNEHQMIGTPHELHARHCFQWLRDSRCLQFSSYRSFEEEENSQSEVGLRIDPKIT